MKYAFTLAFLLLMAPQITQAQRGNMVIPSGALIEVPNGAQICADTIFANNPGYGTLTLANSNGLCAGSIIVPVEFLSFSATASGSVVTLHWRTSRESGCAGFEVQRGLENRPQWTAVGFVESKGASSSEQTYAFDDVLAPGMPAVPLLRYRLKQLDFDGSVMYSPVLEVRLNSAPGKLDLHIYPNPATGLLQASSDLPDGAPARIAIYSPAGEEVMSCAVSGPSGGSGHSLSLDLTSMPPGHYLIELLAGTSRIVRRFVLAR